MLHGLDRQFLYCAVKIQALFSDRSGARKAVSGTAFFVKIANDVLLVTNRHVVELEFKDSKFIGYSLVELHLEGRFAGDDLNQFSIVAPFQFIFHADEANDIAALNMGGARIATKHHISLNYFVPQSLIATQADFQGDIEVCDFVAFPGFPMWHDQTENRPIFRVGTIASDPRHDYHFGHGEGAIGGQCIAYEAFSYGGSSGSPVFALQKGIRPGAGVKFDGYRDVRLIGINGGHLSSADTSHSGMSYFYRSSLLFELS